MEMKMFFPPHAVLWIKARFADILRIIRPNERYEATTSLFRQRRLGRLLKALSRLSLRPYLAELTAYEMCHRHTCDKFTASCFVGKARNCVETRSTDFASGKCLKGKRGCDVIPTFDDRK